MQGVSQTFYADLQALFVALSRTLLAQVKTNLALCVSLNASMAHFVCRALNILDRGLTFGLVQRHLHVLASTTDHYLIRCRFEFLGIVCSHEHYVALNLPQLEESLDDTITPLSASFLQRHFLVGTLLTEVGF